MRITFKAFDSKLASREKLFKAALEFANKIKREDLITITHSEDRDNIVVTIWYWTEDAGDKREAIRAHVKAVSGATGVIGGEGEPSRAPQEHIPRANPETRTDLPSLDAPAPKPVENDPWGD